jgi:HEAT repeat protein
VSVRAALVALCSLLLFGSTPASRARAGDDALPTLGGLRAELESHDEKRVLAAIDGLAKRRGLPAFEALAAFIRAGQPDAWADRAIAALGSQPTAQALPLLTELVRHRRPGARVAALRAVAAHRGPEADALIEAGLRDGDAAVRGASARLLGERGQRSALEVLFQALERGVPEAARAIGQLGDAASVTRLHGLLGRQPLAVMLTGYEALLARADVAEDTKLDIVARLGELAVVPVKRFLEQRLTARGAPRSKRLARALRETARRIAEPSAPRTQVGP